MIAPISEWFQSSFYTKILKIFIFSRSGPRFILPGTPNSPPKILSLDEVQDVVKNIKNMALAHEIAINTDFKLTPYEPEENTIERIIKDTMHKAFWDILKLQIESDPPCFDHAIQLLADIKEVRCILILKKISNIFNEMCFFHSASSPYSCKITRKL